MDDCKFRNSPMDAPGLRGGVSVGRRRDKQKVDTSGSGFGGSFGDLLRAQGLAPATALRAAALAARRDNPHPFHWAPFTLMGDGG